MKDSKRVRHATVNNVFCTYTLMVLYFDDQNIYSRGRKLVRLIATSSVEMVWN